MSESPKKLAPNSVSSSQKANSSQAGFHFPLGFDPLRWIYALLIRIYWPIGLAILLAVFGYLVGAHWNSERFSVSLQLIRKPVPSVIKAGEQGDAFRPRQLNDRSLRSTLLANEAIYKTANSLGLDPEELKESVEIDQLEGTDFFYITVHSDVSGEEALEIVALWADEIIHYTIGIQRRESITMRELLEEENNDLARDLESINQRLLSFSTDNDFLDGDKQLEASLRAMGAMELALEDGRILLTSKEEQLKSLTKELQALSPISDQLKTAKEELAQLRGRYTDANPLVKEKLYEMQYLEERQREEAENPGDDLRRFTGTPLGNQLYLEIVQARNERMQYEQRTQEYERLLKDQRAKIQHLPRQILRYSELLQQRDQIRRAYDLLNSRLQEARIFSENAPGYWEIFQSPSDGDVHVELDRQKAFLLGFAGLVAGASLGVVLSLFFEMRRPSRDFPLAYAITAKAMPVLDLPLEDKEAWRPQLNAFWLTDLIRLQRDGYLVIVTTHTEDTSEIPFWETLLEFANSDSTPLSVLDLSLKPGGLGTLGEQQTHWRELGDWHAWAQKQLALGPVILRLHGDPYPAIFPILEQVGHWLCLVDEHCSLGTFRNDLRPYANTLQSPDGLILVRTSAPNIVAAFFEKAGLLLGSLLRKKPEYSVS